MEKTKKEKQVVNLIYRNNSLFRKNVPIITEQLQSLNCEVKFKIFPEEIDWGEIKDWYAQNKHEPVLKNLITDRTFRLATEHDPLVTLDEIIDRALLSALELDVGWEDFEKEANTGKGISSIVKCILEERENVPDLVFISKGNILDHRPFHENHTADEAAEKIRSWLIDGGISPEIITIISKKVEWTCLDGIDRPHNWIIRDRHQGHAPEIANAHILHIPFGDFCEKVRRNGILKLKDEKFKVAIRKILEKWFA